MTDECCTTEARSRISRRAWRQDSTEREEERQKKSFMRYTSKNPKPCVRRGYRSKSICNLCFGEGVWEVTGCSLRPRHAIPSSSHSLSLKGLWQHHTDVCCCTYPFSCRKACVNECIIGLLQQQYHIMALLLSISVHVLAPILPLLHIRAI